MLDRIAVVTDSRRTARRAPRGWGVALGTRSPCPRRLIGDRTDAGLRVRQCARVDVVNIVCPDLVLARRSTYTPGSAPPTTRAASSSERAGVPPADISLVVEHGRWPRSSPTSLIR